MNQFKPITSTTDFFDLSVKKTPKTKKCLRDFSFSEESDDTDIIIEETDLEEEEKVNKLPTIIEEEEKIDLGADSDKENKQPSSLDSDSMDEDFEDLVNFYSDVTDFKEREIEKEIKEKIKTNRWYYLKNSTNEIISLKKKIYLKYKNDENFIGYSYKQDFKDKDIIVLLTQVVNEREKIKSIGKILFFRENYLSTFKKEKTKKLFRKYIGLPKNEIEFINEEKENVFFYRWCIKVHKRRFNLLVSLIKEYDNNNSKKIFNNIDIDKDVINSCKNYDNVLDICLKLLK